MERCKRILHKMLYPHWALVLLLALASAAGLVWVFVLGNEASWIAYVVYVLSAYALTTVCLVLTPLILRWSRRQKQAKTQRTPEQRDAAFRNSLYRSMWMKLAYAVYNLAAGIVMASTWMGSQGLYYLVLAAIQLVLERYERRIHASEDPAERKQIGWGGFQLCGILLLLLHLTMTGVVFQIIWGGRGKSYYGMLIFVNAAYTFYRLTAAIIDVLQCRKNPNPIWGAKQNITLSEVLMSVFFLQTAMFASFGGDFQYQHLMNSLTGSAVCLLAVWGALGMIFHGRRKKLEK